MKLISKFKENEMFEKSLREKYSNEVCDVVMEWTEDALSYVFKATSDKTLFRLGLVDRDDNSIDYMEDMLTLEDIICRVISEMEYALDGTENKDIIEDEIRILSEAL
ncbi:MAG: hypothetical protein IJ086_07430 [Clostridium sp.]|nr:hypothetical protein [Clostridium sp.]MBQ8998500.1 hypothetical protein [Clostridium sp.]